MTQEQLDAIKRYDFEVTGSGYYTNNEMVKREDGEWMRFEDLRALLSAYQAQKSEIQTLDEMVLGRGDAIDALMLESNQRDAILRELAAILLGRNITSYCMTHSNGAETELGKAAEALYAKIEDLEAQVAALTATGEARMSEAEWRRTFQHIPHAFRGQVGADRCLDCGEFRQHAYHKI